jgi:hypothetical protein
MKTRINSPFQLLPCYKPLNKKHAETRQGPLRDEGYRAWVIRFPCQICNRLAAKESKMGAVSIAGQADALALVNVPGPYFNAGTESWTEAAHTENNGMSSKGPDSSCVPLCRKHHAQYDAGRKAFEQKYGVDMKAIADELYALYQRKTESAK